jgi:putative flippase GtrA
VKAQDRSRTSMDLMEKLSSLLLLSPFGQLVKHRFIKFGTIGFLGTIVNLVFIFLNQSVIFKSIYPSQIRFNLSLAGAIFISTVHNFLWNRFWTWGDRKSVIKKSIFLQALQYFAACWVSILLQFVFANILALFLHYLIATVIAIMGAAITNYMLNDKWTFSN